MNSYTVAVAICRDIGYPYTLSGKASVYTKHVTCVHMIQINANNIFILNCTCIIVLAEISACGRSTVTWKLMVVDGQSFRGEWMALKASQLSVQLAMFVDLDNWMENFG